MTVQLSVLVERDGIKTHLIAEFGVGNLANLLTLNCPALSPEGALALAQLVSLGGVGELGGVRVTGAATDGARAVCADCGWETPLRRVRTHEDFSVYVRGKSQFVDPRDIGRFQRGQPLYFPPGACELCGGVLTGANIVGGPE